MSTSNLQRIRQVIATAISEARHGELLGNLLADMRKELSLWRDEDVVVEASSNEMPPQCVTDLVTVRHNHLRDSKTLKATGFIESLDSLRSSRSSALVGAYVRHVQGTLYWLFYDADGRVDVAIKIAKLAR